MSTTAPSVETIQVSKTDGVAELRICNTAKRNALSVDMWNELQRFANDTAGDRTVRVILVAGNNTEFSSGADIQEFTELRARGATHTYDNLVENALRSLEAVPQTTVACIAGPCVGAGASLACSCDIRIADEDAYFMIPAARLGLGYDPRGIARFVRVFGDSIVRNLLLGAQRHEASAAHAQGAVQRLVKPGTVLNECRILARKIAQNAPLTMAAAKAALNELAVSDAANEAIQQLALTADESADYSEGLLAFQEKRKPRFQGR